jgi:acyl-CoA thioester hydrolase
VIPAWDLPAAFIHTVSALASDVDAQGHVNNPVYLRWLDQTAWGHSAALGVSAEHCGEPRAI